jgi:hypothetical protein
VVNAPPLPAPGIATHSMKGMRIMTSVTHPTTRHAAPPRTVRLVTWSIQAAIALGLALVASLAARGLGIMLIAASVGVLIASGVGLGVRVLDDDTRTERDE